MKGPRFPPAWGWVRQGMLSDGKGKKRGTYTDDSDVLDGGCHCLDVERRAISCFGSSAVADDALQVYECLLDCRCLFLGHLPGFIYSTVEEQGPAFGIRGSQSVRVCVMVASRNTSLWKPWSNQIAQHLEVNGNSVSNARSYD